MSNTPKHLKELYSGLLNETDKNPLMIENREPKEIKLVFEMIQESFDSAEDEKSEFRSVKSIFQDFGKLPAINAKLDSFSNFNRKMNASETGIVSLFSLTVNPEDKKIVLFIPESSLRLSEFASLVGKNFVLNSKKHKFGFVITSVGFDYQYTIEPAQIGLQPNMKSYSVNIQFPILIVTASYSKEIVTPGAIDLIESVNSKIIGTIPSASSESDFFYKSLDKDMATTLVSRIVKSKEFESYRLNNKKLIINS